MERFQLGIGHRPRLAWGSPPPVLDQRERSPGRGMTLPVGFARPRPAVVRSLPCRAWPAIHRAAAVVFRGDQEDSHRMTIKHGEATMAVIALEATFFPAHEVYLPHARTITATPVLAAAPA